MNYTCFGESSSAVKEKDGAYDIRYAIGDLCWELESTIGIWLIMVFGEDSGGED
jgi:hypothetical protein